MSWDPGHGASQVTLPEHLATCRRLDAMIRCNGNLSAICWPRLRSSGSTSASGQLPQHPVPALVAAPYREAPRDQHHYQTPDKPAQALTSLLHGNCHSYKLFAALSLRKAPTKRLIMSVSLFSGHPCFCNTINFIALPSRAFEVSGAVRVTCVYRSSRRIAFADGFL